jgi:AcrR family transcriptional regulator
VNKKGQITRENILQQAAVLFNSRGFAGASLAELMQATGLKKGGIYNHFHSKEEILIESFEYSVRVVKDKLRRAIKNKKTATEKLKGIIEYYRDFPQNPAIKGGCPILNSLVDSDSTNPLLKEKVKIAVNDLINELKRIITYGVRKGEFKENADIEKASIFIFTSIEGAIAISRGQEENRYMEIIVDHLLDYIDKELKK